MKHHFTPREQEVLNILNRYQTPMTPEEIGRVIDSRFPPKVNAALKRLKKLNLVQQVGQKFTVAS